MGKAPHPSGRCPATFPRGEGFLILTFTVSINGIYSCSKSQKGFFLLDIITDFVDLSVLFFQKKHTNPDFLWGFGVFLRLLA
ncbi:MAG: hypothetical protein RR614_08375, partial [Eubacterium sp.]